LACSFERGVGLQYAGFSSVTNYGLGRILHASLSRSDELREAYIEKMKRYAADDLEFLDEAIFYENMK
jgi:hypothetical protein